MTPRGDTVVLGVGARIATGLDALGTTTSLRARKAFVRESHFVSSAGEPIGLAVVAGAGDDLVGRDRFVALARAPLAEATLPWRRRFELERRPAPPLPLLLASPTESDPLDPRGARLLSALAEHSGVALDPARSRLVAQGRAAGVFAIEQAIARIASGEDEAVLVGGIDSFFDPDRLEALDRERRLHGPGTENGFVPGEGAAFLLLGGRRRAGDLRRLASFVGVGTEKEPRPYGASEPCHALGITLAMKRALVSAPATRIGWALSDVVGERHRVDEWLLASGRIQASFAPEIVHDTPLLLTGDLGAASVPTLAVIACTSWQIGAAPADVALLAAHSDGAERGALVLAREEG